MKNIKSSIIIIIFFTIISVITFFLMEFLVEPKITNALTKIFLAPKANENVVMVMIDQKSIDRIRWPWKREFYANIIKYIHDYGQAKVIAYDSMITSPDNDFPDSDKYFFDTIKNYDNFIGIFNSGAGLPKESIFNTNEYNLLSQKSRINVKYKLNLPPSTHTGILKFHPEYLSSVKSFGAATTPVELDGYIRYALPIVRINNESYPMLAFAAYAKYKNLDGFTVTEDYLCSNDNCKTLKVKIKNSILGPKMKLKWYRTIDEFSTHKTYSAIDVLDSYSLVNENKKPIVSPEAFKDKIVIVGAAAAKVKSLEDIKSTPMITNTHAGADIQATVVSNLLENNVLSEPTFIQKILICSIIALISILIISSLGLGASLTSLSLLMIGYFATATILFAKGIVIQIITPIVIVLLILSAGFMFRFLIEGHKKEQIQNAMGLYISKDIMKSVVKNIDNIQLGGKRANITVLFSDIRGFTSISEQLSAEEVTEILNEYFSAVEPIIRKHKGVLNKFIGDAVLAIFGEPIQDKNHALNAVLCANEMHKKMQNIQEKWDLEGKPHIEIGIAINTGDAFVGNIGSPERIEYTVIGDTVNTASRIEAYNKVYKTKFLISESTYEKVSRICDVIKIREVSIRGKARKINIYEVLRITENNDT